MVRFFRERHRTQVGLARGEPPPARDVAVELGEPLLAVAVDVIGQRVAGLLNGFEEGPEQRGLGGAALQDQRARTAAPGIGSGGGGLHPLEVRQAVGVVPLLHARVGRPPLEVQRVPPLEDHPIDARGATEDLAAGVEDPATTHVLLRLGLVLPVVEPVADRVRQRRRHVDEGIELGVGAAGLQDQHAGRGVGGEAIGQRRACRATPDNDVVEVVGHGLSRPLGRRTSPAARAGCGARCAWSRGTPPDLRARARVRSRSACSRPTRPAARRGGSR